MSDRGWGSKRNVAPYLGVAIVFVIGFWGILTPVLLAYPGEFLTSAVCIAAVLLLVLVILRKLAPAEDLPSSIYGWVLGRKVVDDGLHGYEPLTRRRNRSVAGQQGPPSVESVRDIKQSNNNWVPTGNQAPRRVARSRRLGQDDRKSGLSDDRHSLG